MEEKDFVKDCCFWFTVNCNDLFEWALADAEQFSVGDLAKFKEAYSKYGVDGVNALCSLKKKREVMMIFRTVAYRTARREYENYKFEDL